MANLHNLLNDIPFGDLPPAWTTFDLASFSRAKSLWDYQQSALQNALKTLWKYSKDDVVVRGVSPEAASSQQGIAHLHDLLSKSRTAHTCPPTRSASGTVVAGSARECRRKGKRPPRNDIMVNHNNMTNTRILRQRALLPKQDNRYL